MGPAYAKGTATTGNPYGTPMILTERELHRRQWKELGIRWITTKRIFNRLKTDILVRFEEFTGLYVDHCHLLFHEDSGMMVPVLTILNTNDSWITNDSQKGQR